MRVPTTRDSILGGVSTVYRVVSLADDEALIAGIGRARLVGLERRLAGRDARRDGHAADGERDDLREHRCAPPQRPGRPRMPAALRAHTTRSARRAAGILVWAISVNQPIDDEY